MPEKRFDLQALFDGGDFPITDLGEEQYASRKFDKAAQLLDNIITEERFVEFLAPPAYQYLP